MSTTLFLSSAFSVPYRLVTDSGITLGLNEISNGVFTQISGDGGNLGNLKVLYEGFAVSDTSGGLIGPSLGVVSDPAALGDRAEAIRMIFLLYQDFAGGSFAPTLDSAEIDFSEPIPVP